MGGWTWIRTGWTKNTKYETKLGSMLTQAHQDKMKAQVDLSLWTWISRTRLLSPSLAKLGLWRLFHQPCGDLEMPRMRRWIMRLSTEKQQVFSLIISSTMCKVDAILRHGATAHHRTGHYSGSAAGGAITRRLGLRRFWMHDFSIKQRRVRKVPYLPPSISMSRPGLGKNLPLC